jgi:hypothetical protein
VLLVLLFAALLAWSLTGDERAAVQDQKPPPQTPLLSEAEAAAEFERLHALLQRAYRDRDESLVSLYAAPDSPKLREAHTEIRQLLRDDILYRHRVRQQEVLVTSVTESEILVTQVVDVYPRFIEEGTGENVARGGPETLTIEWVMRLYPQGWRLYQGTVVHAEDIR